jgi:hypothetical protein
MIASRYGPGDPGSILGRTSTQGLEILRRKCYLYIDISNYGHTFARVLGQER